MQCSNRFLKALLTLFILTFSTMQKKNSKEKSQTRAAHYLVNNCKLLASGQILTKLIRAKWFINRDILERFPSLYMREGKNKGPASRQ